MVVPAISPTSVLAPPNNAELGPKRSAPTNEIIEKAITPTTTLPILFLSVFINAIC